MSAVPEAQFKAFLESLGLEPEGRDAHLAETPRLFTALLASFVDVGPEPEISLIPATADHEVAVRGLAFYSLCEHHLLPFFGEIDVVYRPGEVLAGLGGIARCVTHCARRLQLQERLTEQVADCLYRQLRPRSLSVVSRARHMCLEMRGGNPGATLTVTAHRGGLPGE